MNRYLLWNLVLSDAGLFASYIFIAWGLVRYAAEQNKNPFRDVTILFALFIGFGGIGHAVQAWVHFAPAFWAEVIIQWMTLGLSMAAGMVWFFRYKSRVEYDTANEEMRTVFYEKQLELERRIEVLESRV